MKVTVYSTKTCAYCVKLKQWLVNHAIEFTDVYIDSDTGAMQKMIELSGQMSVPFTTIEIEDGNTQNLIGFDETKLKDIFTSKNEE